MSLCASFPRVEERTRAAVRLFQPDEVATVIDLFAPLTQVRARAAASVRGFDWPRITAAVTLTTGVFLIGAALVSEPPREPPRPPRPAAVVAVVKRVAPAPALAAAPPPRPPADLAPIPIVAVVIEPEPRPPSPTAVLAALNRTALAAYQRGEAAAALATLTRGVRLCQRPALAWHALCARTHLHAAVVLAGGHHQTGLAAKHFRIARAIQPAITLPARFTAPGIITAFEDARR